ncbi:hypothetical protein CgunFtcFv8_011214 [Champsocephalus gunnari]|uniref:Uncharacterized protein n=1 Tax=Champsocephalus gunnari TaxID=52237 RepID=A0AAN8D415_CHAGU|nr:hypothetical protein CgunFtcFv8_011214 [Champsocephalus gunnari]
MQPLPATCSHFLRHAATSCDMQPLPATCSHFLRHAATSCDTQPCSHFLRHAAMQPPPATCSRFLRHAAASCDMQQLPATRSHFLRHAAMQPLPATRSHFLQHAAPTPDTGDSCNKKHESQAASCQHTCRHAAALCNMLSRSRTFSVCVTNEWHTEGRRKRVGETWNKWKARCPDGERRRVRQRGKAHHSLHSSRPT